MKYGLILTRSDIQGQIDAAKRADEPASSRCGRRSSSTNGLVRLAAVATETQRVKLGTGIAYAFMRSPMLAATAAMDIDEISGGRMILGSARHASDEREVVSTPFNDPPAPRIERRDRPDTRRFAAQKAAASASRAATIT